MRGDQKAYAGLEVYFGDIHSHCAVGYGHGSIEDAFANAKLQLDFASITPHAHWPDIPEEEERLADVVAYHKAGFERTAAQWPHVQELVEAMYEPGQFVTFLGFEWHSRKYGDHNVYYKGSRGEIIRAGSLEEMREELRRLAAQGVASFVIPHHIGYKQGYRGINWQTFTSEFSPVVEIISMHGVAESNDAPYPYLHTMGPRDWESTWHYGLSLGHVVGVYGSTDHHSAHPGSHGRGRMAVWATSLTRDGIWEAIRNRRTYALTGDRIVLAFSVNGEPMGAVLPATEERHIEVAVVGGGALDYVELLHNDRVIDHWSSHDLRFDDMSANSSRRFKVHFEVGWSEKDVVVPWQVELQVAQGQLVDVEPRFRGHEILAPQAKEQATYAFSCWEQLDQGVRFVTQTWGNPTGTTACTQGVCLEMLGDESTLISGTVNGQPVQVSLGRLMDGSYVGYLGGFLTPAYCFQRAVPKAEYAGRLSYLHHHMSEQRDWYTVRVRQKNDQWAWSSPIWVAGLDGGSGSI